MGGSSPRRSPIKTSLSVVVVRVFGMLLNGQHAFNFGYGYHGQIATEQAEQREEDTKATDQHRDVESSRTVVSPAGRQEVAAERGNGNHKAFEPHPDVHEDRYHPHRQDVGAEVSEPEQLGRDHVAGNHDPVCPPVRTEGSVDKRELFVGVTRVPGDEELGRVGQAHHRTGGQG